MQPSIILTSKALDWEFSLSLMMMIMMMDSTVVKAAPTGHPQALDGWKSGVFAPSVGVRGVQSATCVLAPQEQFAWVAVRSFLSI
jgi:hypothetical protein